MRFDVFLSICSIAIMFIHNWTIWCFFWRLRENERKIGITPNAVFQVTFMKKKKIYLNRNSEKSPSKQIKLNKLSNVLALKVKKKHQRNVAFAVVYGNFNICWIRTKNENPKTEKIREYRVHLQWAANKNKRKTNFNLLILMHVICSLKSTIHELPTKL